MRSVCDPTLWAIMSDASYVAWAINCQRLAEHAPNDEIRASWLKLAASWLRMAAEKVNRASEPEFQTLPDEITAQAGSTARH